MSIPETVISLRDVHGEFPLAAWQRETGSQDLIIFAHGLACSKESFRDVWQRTEFRDYSLLAFDWPGFGRSPRPADYLHALADQARLLAMVVDTYASRRIHLVAHSMGGTTSLLLPSRARARLENHVLVEPRFLLASCGVAAEVSSFDYEAFVHDYLPKFRRRVVSDPRVNFDADRAEPEAFYRSAQSLVDCCRAGGLTERFLDSPCSAWFVYGADNSHLGEISALPATQTFGIDAAGHFPMHDNPADFYALLLRLVQTPPAA